MSDIYELSKGRTKDDFRASLDDRIRDSIAIDGDYSGLSYEKKQEYEKISKLLLLFNVESVRRNGEETQWFPFEKFKFSKGSNVSWSLEHIHAQQSEGLRTQDLWKKWISLHIPSVQAVASNQEELINRMNSAVEKERLERSEFDAIQGQVFDVLSYGDSADYLHTIGNLALLNTANNAALNNSTFDVKRNEIIKMDKKGQFIPFCTKMVFLKYYTPSEDNQLHFWGQADRIAYIKAINETLEDYLAEPIAIEKEEA